MLEVIGAVVIAGLVAALAVTGVAVGTLAAIAVVLVVVGVACAALGVAIIFVVKIAVALLIVALLQKLLNTCLVRIGDAFRLPALQDASVVDKVSFVLSWLCAVYICFVKW